MTLSDPSEIWNLLEFDSYEDKIEFFAARIQLEILSELSKQMEELGVTKYDLAARTGISEKDISRLFAVDKWLDLKTLAKLEDAIGKLCRFDTFQ